MELFEKDSVKDLLLRGYGLFQAAHANNLHDRFIMQQLRDEINNASVFDYRVLHLIERYTNTDVCEAFDRYGQNDVTNPQFWNLFGLRVRSEKEFAMRPFFEACGYLSLFEKSCEQRQQSISQKIQVTCMHRYGGVSPMSSDDIKSKVRNTTYQRYGVENASQSDVVKEKKKQTLLQNYGVEYTTQSDVIKKRIKDTCSKKYGVENVSQSDVIKNKKIKTSMEHYGVKYTMQDETVRQKMMQTLCDNYGIEYDDTMSYPFQVPEVLAKCKETLYERTGYSNPFEDPAVQEAIREHWVNEFGIDNVSRIPEFQKKREETFIQKYGVSNPFSAECVQTKIIDTLQEKYGITHPVENDLFRDKIHATVRERYGTDWPMQNEDVKMRVLMTKRERGTFHTSSSEELLYNILCDIFGQDDVLRQYCSDEYPYACDFYIKSRRLYIELNGSWTHGRHWFSDDETDVDVLSMWHEKCTEYYDNAIHVWTKKDVEKRNKAKSNNLNYLVFWDSSLLDVYLWQACGCPDAKDWLVEYSWLHNLADIRDVQFTKQYPSWGTWIGYVLSYFWSVHKLLPGQVSASDILTHFSSKVVL